MLDFNNFKIDENLVPIIYQSWERPLYLWSSLDSLSKCNLTKSQLLCFDNNSSDKLVIHILKAFKKRSLIDQIISFKKNSPFNLKNLIEKILLTSCEYFVYMESDVKIESQYKDWFQIYLNIMKDNPKMGILGSLCDKTDFINLKNVEKKDESILKINSPEKNFFLDSDLKYSDPFNPPARLLIVRTKAVKEVGWASDAQLYQRMKKGGWNSGITPLVVHRHLSLQNYYDYPDYDMKNRDEFVSVLK